MKKNAQHSQAKNLLWPTAILLMSFTGDLMAQNKAPTKLSPEEQKIVQEGRKEFKKKAPPASADLQLRVQSESDPKSSPEKEKLLGELLLQSRKLNESHIKSLILTSVKMQKKEAAAAKKKQPKRK